MQIVQDGDTRQEESLLPVSMEQRDSGQVIRLAGAVGVASAEELKRLLLEGLAAEGGLRLDLERAGEIDITIMQLLWAAGREARRTGARVELAPSEAAATAARGAGFESFPGSQAQE